MHVTFVLGIDFQYSKYQESGTIEWLLYRPKHSGKCRHLHFSACLSPSLYLPLSPLTSLSLFVYLPFSFSLFVVSHSPSLPVSLCFFMSLLLFYSLHRHLSFLSVCLSLSLSLSLSLYLSLVNTRISRGKII